MRTTMTTATDPEEPVSGCPAVFEQLYRTYASRVTAYARGRTDADEAHDVTAETFVVAWRRLDEVPDKPLPWLLTTARNILGTRQRSRARRTALHDRVARQGPAAVQHDHADEVTDRLLARAALAALSAQERAALGLGGRGLGSRGLGSRSPGDRPSAAPCHSPSAARARLHRARRRLSDALRAHENLPARG